jgi:hypothetical protein
MKSTHTRTDRLLATLSTPTVDRKENWGPAAVVVVIVVVVIVVVVVVVGRAGQPRG